MYNKVKIIGKTKKMFLMREVIIMRNLKSEFCLILLLLSFCMYVPTAKADEVTYEIKTINDTKEFVEYNFAITENGQPVSGKHVVVLVTFGNKIFTILSAPSNFSGQTSIIIPNTPTIANRSQNSYTTVPEGEPLGCCEEIFYCFGEVCGSTCFSVYTEEDISNCELIGEITPNIDTEYHPGQICVVNDNGTCQCEEITLIELFELNASASNRSAVITWTTKSEIDNAGFNIYRAESEDGEYVKINDNLIPAAGSPTESASYKFVDGDVNNRKTYYYKLEDIDLNGVSTMHGPVSATPRLIYGIIKN